MRKRGSEGRLTGRKGEHEIKVESERGINTGRQGSFMVSGWGMTARLTVHRHPSGRGSPQQDQSNRYCTENVTTYCEAL